MKQKTLSQFKQDLSYNLRDPKLTLENLRLMKPLLNESDFKTLQTILIEDRFDLNKIPESIESLATVFNHFATLKESYDSFYEDVLGQVEQSIPDPLATVDEIIVNVGENEVSLKNNHGRVRLTMDGKQFVVPGRVVNMEALAQTVINFLEDFDEADPIEEAAPSEEEGVLNIDPEKKENVSQNTEDVPEVPDMDSEEEDETAKEISLDKEIETTSDETKKQKLQILKNIIDVKLIRKYATDQTERNRIVSALKNYILKGEDENYIKSEVQQQALIDFFLDLVDILLTNKRIANLVAVNASVKESIESVEEFEQILTEAKKEPKFTGKRANSKKKKSPVDRVTPKLEMLLRLGLVDKSLFARARKALTAKKEYGTIPFYRNLMLDMLDDLIEYIQSDPTLYNRMRINVMKEMKKSYLPSKKTVVDAYNAGMNHVGTEDEIPEEYNQYFTKEAFIRGMQEACKKKDKPMAEAKMDSADTFRKKGNISIKPTKKEYLDAGYELVYKFVSGEDRSWYEAYLYQNGEEIIEIVDDSLIDNVYKNPDDDFQYKLMDEAGQAEIAKLFDSYLDKYYNVKTEAWSIRNLLKAGAKAGMKGAKMVSKQAGSTLSSVGKGTKDPLISGLGKGLSKLGEEDYSEYKQDIRNHTSPGLISKETLKNYIKMAGAKLESYDSKTGEFEIAGTRGALRKFNTMFVQDFPGEPYYDHHEMESWTGGGTVVYTPIDKPIGEETISEAISKYKYKNRKGEDRIGVHFNESDLEKNLGFCIACGTKHDHVEPDARKYECKKCKQNLVYGLEELMMMGIAKPKMGRE